MDLSKHGTPMYGHFDREAAGRRCESQPFPTVPYNKRVQEKTVDVMHKSYNRLRLLTTRLQPLMCAVRSIHWLHSHTWRGENPQYHVGNQHIHDVYQSTQVLTHNHIYI
jgi:hypothetical protein